ncbi:T9SS type A sorting domain-containing protein [Pedobacter glucosidilyticus]|uniref:T9SS type A sorting domain-containing protein n=1 Tax=Pedobacter glucosidilyticus TaxID=1122941 RepID=UPI0026EA727A|nr:T9SS type A sorting domain-containing protein [Pedobacter glucosidilyticus]
MKKFLLFLLGLSNSVFAQISIIENNTYNQDFNGLGTTTVAWSDNVNLNGWYAAAASLSSIGDINISTGSSTAGSLYNLGLSGEADRSLGSLVSGTTGTIYYGLRLKNNTSTELKSLTISYTGEQWRRVTGGTEQKLQFSYQVSSNAITNLTTGSWIASNSLDFTSPTLGTTGLLNGNDASNRAIITATINVTIPAGSEIMLRWMDIDDSGNDFALGIDDLSVTPFSTLPIQLSSFNAQAIDKTILLNWETLSETENASFEIERSVDGISFTKIGSKEGSGTTTALTKYRFVDENPLPGTNYYRLKQIDIDGKSEILAVKSAISNISFATLSVLQNSNTVTAQILSPVKEKAKLSLFDIGGKVLAQQDILLENGLNRFDFSQNLVSGVYFFKLTSASNQINTKFIKL